MLQPTDSAAGLPRAAVGGLHQPRPAAGDDRVAGSARGTRRARARARRSGCSRGVRAEPNTVTAGPDVRERGEAARELARDVADALGVGGAHLRRLVAQPQQQLLVERRPCRRRLLAAPARPCAASVCAGRRDAGVRPRAVAAGAAYPSLRPCAATRQPAGEEIPYTVRRSARARSVRVNVHAHAGRRGRAARPAPPSGPRRPRSRSCARGSSGAWPRRARRWRVIAERAARPCPTSGSRWSSSPQPGRTRVHRRGERLLVPAGDAAPGARALLPARRARRDRAAARPRHRARRAALQRPRRSARQRTRWASCSADGHMSFNWRLLLAPERVLEYVVWHEVCHLEIARPLAAASGRCSSGAGPSYRERPRAGCARNGATLVLSA